LLLSTKVRRSYKNATVIPELTGTNLLFGYPLKLPSISLKCGKTIAASSKEILERFDGDFAMDSFAIDVCRKYDVK
jgi:hypothetical protein